MAKREYKKPRLSFQIELEDQALLDAVKGQLPGVNQSFLLRAALRLGLRELLDEPAKVTTPPADPPAEPRAAKKGRRAKRRS